MTIQERADRLYNGLAQQTGEYCRMNNDEAVPAVIVDLPTGVLVTDMTRPGMVGIHYYSMTNEKEFHNTVTIRDLVDIDSREKSPVRQTEEYVN